MKTVTRSFNPSDRYDYDFSKCSSANGWAQLDTSQDASYFGTWINPTRRVILCYCEGDVIVSQMDTDESLVREVAEIRQWNIEQGHRFLGIDPGFNAELKESLILAGLGGYLH